MDDFNYLAVLISIILGLGMTQLLSGLGRWIEGRAQSGFYAPTLVWVIVLLLLHVQTWWTLYGLRLHQGWSFLQFAVVLLQPTVLFLLTVLALPSAGSAIVDPRTNYYAQRHWFFGFLILLLLVSVARDLAMTGELPAPGNLAFHATVLLIALVGMASARESHHRAMAVLVAALVLGYIGLLHPALR